MSHVLIVEDDPVQSVRFAALLQRTGYDAWAVAGGESALDALDERRYDAAVVDLPEVCGEACGTGLVERIADRHPNMPIVAVLPHADGDLAVEALQAGAATYVARRNLPRDLSGLLDNLLALTRHVRSQEWLQASLTQMESHFSLENDPDLVMPLVSYLLENVTRMELCDARGRMRLGLALREAIVNAMELGNLAAQAELRDRDEGEWNRLLEQRRTERPYCLRRVRVMAKVSREEAAFVIRDEGTGFDAAQRRRLADGAGRGLVLIRTFMDEVFHNVTGNQITMLKRRATPALVEATGLTLSLTP